MTDDDFEMFVTALRSLEGETVLRVERVVVWVPEGAMQQVDTVVLRMESGRRVQLLSDGYRQWLRSMEGDKDYCILGEYSDRTSDALVDVTWVDVPIGIDEMRLAYSVDNANGRKSVVGFWILSSDPPGANGQPRMSINCHDDIEVGPPKMLWEYLAGIFYGEPVLAIERL